MNMHADPTLAGRPVASEAPFISLRSASRVYGEGNNATVVLKDVDLDIAEGEFVAIVGQSGSGKSTLMNILGCLDRPTAGSFKIGGRETAALGPDDLAALRRSHAALSRATVPVTRSYKKASRAWFRSICPGTRSMEKHEKAT